jgi:hypothetical protein
MKNEIKSSEITPENVYLNRRNFMRGGILAGTALATAGLYRYLNPTPLPEVETAKIEAIQRSNENVSTADILPITTIITNFRRAKPA